MVKKVLLFALALALAVAGAARLWPDRSKRNGPATVLRVSRL